MSCLYQLPCDKLSVKLMTIEIANLNLFKPVFPVWNWRAWLGPEQVLGVALYRDKKLAEQVETRCNRPLQVPRGPPDDDVFVPRGRTRKMEFRWECHNFLPIKCSGKVEVLTNICSDLIIAFKEQRLFSQFTVKLRWSLQVQICMTQC